MSFDIKNLDMWLRSVHVYTAPTVNGAQLASGYIHVRYGAASAEQVHVEPSHYSGVNPDPNAHLDQLTRLVLITSIDGGGVDPANMPMSLFYKRSGLSTVARTGIIPATVLGSSSVLVIDNAFGPGFMTVGPNNINDVLQARIIIDPVETSAGDVTFTIVALMMPGPITGAQTPPRGAVFSKAGIDY